MCEKYSELISKITGGRLEENVILIWEIGKAKQNYLVNFILNTDKPVQESSLSRYIGWTGVSSVCNSSFGVVASSETIWGCLTSSLKKS